MREFLACGAAVSLAAGLFLTGPAGADVVNVQDAAGVRLDGPSKGSQLGMAVDSAGDFDGDGYDDIVVGSLAVPSAGSAYIVFGGPSLKTGIVGTTRTIQITGEAPNDQLGVGVAGVGDVNKDGLDDVLIGANMASAAYLVLGDSTPADIDLTKPAAGWVKFSGGAGEDTGYAVAGVGDVNQDGYPDMAMGSVGAAGLQGIVYVVFGRATPTELDLTVMNVSQGVPIVGENARDFAGAAVAGIGDVNGDGIPDIGVGASNAPGGAQNGRAYVIYGKAGFTGLSLAAMTADQGFRIDNDTPASFTGAAMAGLGDMNKDGFDDFAVGSPGYATLGDTATILFGRSTSGDIDLPVASDRGVTFSGTPTSYGVGRALAGAGDFDTDGYPDALIGAPTISDTEDLAALVRGSMSMTGGPVADLPDGFRQPTGEAFGAAVAGLGDVNGDGGVDIAVDAYSADRNGDNSGSVYVFYGMVPAKPPVEPTPTPSPSPTVSPKPAASLKVTARPAKRAIPRNGWAVLVRKVVVGPGQRARIAVKAAKKVRVVKTATTVKVRTKHAPKGKVRVRITAKGPGVTDTVWVRRWKVR